MAIGRLRDLSDPDAFASLYETHGREVYASAYRVLGRPTDAEDVTQEVFLRLWSSPERFDPARGDVGPFLRLMARSRALDLWRHQQSGARARDRLEVAGEVEPGERPAEAAERHEAAAAVRTAMRGLPAPQREALFLSYWGGLSADEVARRVQVPFGTARSRVRLGLTKLRDSCAPALADGAPVER
jgi:RNA polymerase sigma-70 factor (ECF subfamily)